jgi:hypothetical protein
MKSATPTIFFPTFIFHFMWTPHLVPFSFCVFVFMWVLYYGHHGCVGAPHFVISCCTWRNNKDAIRNINPCILPFVFCFKWTQHLPTPPFCVFMFHIHLLLFNLSFVVMCSVPNRITLCYVMNNMDMRNVDP